MKARIWEEAGVWYFDVDGGKPHGCRTWNEALARVFAAFDARHAGSP